MKEVVCSPPFGWPAVVTQWQFAPVVTALVALFAGLYLWGVVAGGPAAPGPAVAGLADRLFWPGWPSS